MAKSLLEPDLETLTTQLRERIKVRDIGGKKVYTLELRKAAFGNLGQPTIRRKGHPEWPDKGEAVESLKEAKATCADYAEWLAARLRNAVLLPRKKRVTVPTWAEAIPSFIAHLVATKGDDHSTTRGYRTNLEKHVLPKWGNRALTLDADEVGAWLDGLQVTESHQRRKVLLPAKDNTKRAVRDAMRALWKHYYPRMNPTFGGVRIMNSDAAAERRKAQRSGEILVTNAKYRSPQLLTIMVEAAVLDHTKLRTRPNQLVHAIPNTPEFIAWMVGLLTRVDELMHLRWHGWFQDEKTPMVDLQRSGGVVYLPGTKTGRSPRWVPIFDAFRPWITRMQSLSLSAPESTGFVFQVPQRKATEPPSKKTYQGRLARAEQGAGLKWDGNNTHILRGTATSFLAAKLHLHVIKALIGHSRAAEGATDVYLDPEAMMEALPREVRTYLNGLLPGPEEVYGLARKKLEEQGYEITGDWPPPR